ncbi:MAG: undecaprenyl-diphosphate phosphatase [Chitinophagaceae bacterium]|nr:undecaprenyl-diphosphate phosphatase [Chitinophagaceae bacterium]
MTIFQSIIIAIVEGITEFIPISSTAHMRITENLMGLSITDKFLEVFTVAIQLGAILSVVVLYWRKFIDFKRISFYVKLIVAVIPALIFGKLFKEQIDTILEKPVIIAIIMLAGGIVLLFVDKWFTRPTIKDEQHIGYFTALKIGLYQCLSIIFPGLSRSAATIIGGMSLKLTRSAAAEFSFFLAVPTMFAATIYTLYKYIKENGSFTSEQIKFLAIGNIVAFVVALIAIKFFITLLKRYGFKMWGVYRIIVGMILLLLIWKGIIAGK